MASCTAGQICTTLQLCSGPMASGTVHVLEEGTGATPVDCAIVSSITSLSVSNQGSGYVDVPNVTFTGGSPTTPATATATMAAGKVTGVTLTNPGAGYASVPTVTFDPPPSGVTALATAAVTSKCCVPAPRAGNYLVSTTVNGTVSQQSVVAATCATNNLTIVLSPTPTTYTVNVKGCTHNLPGITVTFVQGATTTSGTTDSLGNVTLTGIPTGITGTMTVTGARWATQSVAGIVPSGCTANSRNFVLSPASGFFCHACCVTPLPNTMFLTDSVFGAVTLGNGAAFQMWTSFPCGTCAGQNNVQFHYGLINDSSGCSVEADWKIRSSDSCPCDNTTGTLCVGTITAYSVPGTFTCPDPTGTTHFSGTWSVVPADSKNPWCSNPTITITE